MTGRRSKRLWERATPAADPSYPPFLSEDGCQALIVRVQGDLSNLPGKHRRTDFSIESNWSGVIRWARNRISVAEEWQDNEIFFQQQQGPARSGVWTNQIDDESLRQAAGWAVRQLRLSGGSGEPRDFVWPLFVPIYPKTHIWSDATYAQSPEQRSAVANHLIDSAERAGMLSAGDISVSAIGVSRRFPDGRLVYAPLTEAQCSLTVRDPQGTGSGWAGCSSYDWTRLDTVKLAAVALEKCLQSRNPVSIEPGRYTTILESQAAWEFTQSIPGGGREHAEQSTMSPWHVGPNGSGQTKLMQQVLDPRVNFSFDPLDPDLGVVPFDIGTGDPMVPVTWIDHGVLTNLAYSRQWALEHLQEPTGKPGSSAFRLAWSAPPVTLDEMIATTTRGVLVTRLWDARVVYAPSLLTTGVTRDGVWLIEHGKITKAVKNMRFRESPLFALNGNNLEQMGTPVPVFSPGSPALVPPIKVRDFQFTALVDAV